MIVWNTLVERYHVALAALVLVFAGIGCRTTPPLQAGGLPDEQYLVGGGLMIDWKAPTEGTAYLVEKNTGKIIETRSLGAGDSYSFSVASSNQATDIERMLGIKLADARFMLYFRPTGSKSSSQ